MTPLTRIVGSAMLVILVIAGCASTPIRSDYSNDMPSLREGKHLDQVWFDENSLKTRHYSEVRLGTARGLGVSNQTNITVDEALQWLRDATLLPGNGSVVLSTGSQGKSATLDLVITELNPGSTAARFWAGEFGAGHAWVQVEGKLFDTNDHKLLAYFVERDRKSGVATFRNSRGYDSGPGLIRDIIEDIGRKIKQEIETMLSVWVG